MERVVVLGRGGAGKTTAARQLGQLTGLPILELDLYFWPADLVPMQRHAWAELQRGLASAPRWVLDGDLGPYDLLAPRLARADTILVLDFGLPRCAWRALRRSWERWDFWWWLLTWRHRSRPVVFRAVAEHAPQADLHVLRNPRQLRRFLDSSRALPPPPPPEQLSLDHVCGPSQRSRGTSWRRRRRT